MMYYVTCIPRPKSINISFTPKRLFIQSSMQTRLRTRSAPADVTATDAPTNDARDHVAPSLPVFTRTQAEGRTPRSNLFASPPTALHGISAVMGPSTASTADAWRIRSADSLRSKGDQRGSSGLSLLEKFNQYQTRDSSGASHPSYSDGGSSSNALRGPPAGSAPELRAPVNSYEDVFSPRSSIHGSRRVHPAALVAEQGHAEIPATTELDEGVSVPGNSTSCYSYSSSC